MLSFTRVCFLALSLALLFTLSIAATPSTAYTVYNGTNCNGTKLDSGSDSNPIYSFSSSVQTFTGSCITVKSVYGGPTYAQINCASTMASMTYYNDSACTIAASPYAFTNTQSGSGACLKNSNLTMNSNLSMPTIGIQCSGNGAFTMAALSVPLMALLALLALISS